MDSSASRWRKLLHFVRDVPYHIQLVYDLTFYYIWSKALQDDHLEDLNLLTEKQKDFQKVFDTAAIFDQIQFLESNHINKNIIDRPTMKSI